MKIPFSNAPFLKFLMVVSWTLSGMLTVCSAEKEERDTLGK